MEAYDRHTPYNQLPPLPPDQALYMDAEVGTKPVQASRRLAELKGLVATLPNQTIFVNTIALREAKASSAIEQPYIRPKNLLSDTIKSVNTAKKYLSQLEDLGLL